MRLNKIIALSLSLALFLTGCQGKEQQTVELLEPVCAQPEYGTVRLGEISDRTYYDGYVTPDLVYAEFEVPGTIGEVYKCMGDEVQKGEALACNDITQLKYEEQNLQRQIEAMKNCKLHMQLLQTAEIQLSQTMLAVSEENRLQLENDLETAKKELQKLKKQSSVSDNDLRKQAKEELQEKKKQIEAAQQQQAYAMEESNDHRHETQQGYLKKDMDEKLSDVDIEELQARLSDIQEQMKQNTIYAPCDGIVAGNVMQEYYVAFNPGFYQNAMGSVYVIAKKDPKYITLGG